MNKLELKEWLGTAVVHVEKVTAIRDWKQWSFDGTTMLDWHGTSPETFNVMIHPSEV